jgi:hypothetical protein
VLEAIAEAAPAAVTIVCQTMRTGKGRGGAAGILAGLSGDRRSSGFSMPTSRPARGVDDFLAVLATVPAVEFVLGSVSC